jgi:retinol dehydrogenase-12
MNLPVDQLTAEGYDMQFGVHVIVRRLAPLAGALVDVAAQAPYLLSVLLHSALKLGAPSAPNGKSRIVHLSSSAAYLNNLDFATFVDGPLRRKQDTAALYCQSKFVRHLAGAVQWRRLTVWALQGNLVLAQEMSRRWAADGIVSHGVHPGAS